MYQDRGMNWRLAIYGVPDIKFYPARIGVMFRDASAIEYSASGIPTSVSIKNLK